MKQYYPDWKLNIFGNGELFEFLNKKIQALALENQVSLKGVSSQIEKEYESGSSKIVELIGNQSVRVRMSENAKEVSRKYSLSIIMYHVSMERII
ncbi:MAG: hypothetical protein PHZ12_02090 [Paludibacter sp.]|nr:hypothetical protein [Paludibacter sp.]MDD4426887.1 hypothetical protein [Paludibacter sp.]